MRALLPAVLIATSLGTFSAGCKRRAMNPSVTLSAELPVFAVDTTPLFPGTVNQTLLITAYPETHIADFQRVRVRGRYQQMNLNKRVDGPPVYGRRVNLILSDGRYVMLNCDEEGIRPEEEVNRCEGKMVEVDGMWFSRCNAWGDGTQATIVGPCVRGVSEVVVVE